MAKNIHLTLDDRFFIEASLRKGASFSEIGRELEKDPSTISKEIKNHREFVKNSTYNPCVNRLICVHQKDLCKICTQNYTKVCKNCISTSCFEICPDFKELKCNKLSKPPYVCNGCENRRSCKLEHILYDARNAQRAYITTRSESRQGISITPAELKRIDKIISPLVKKGQSIHMICANNADDIMLDEKTIYNYVDAGLFSIDNIDLPRKVRYRTRKKPKNLKVDKKCYEGRSYEDFITFITKNPDTPIVEMDSVEGRKGGKVLLTLYFRNSSLILAFIRDCNTSRTVTDTIEQLYNLLGHKTFCELFPIILTDRGSEFSNPLAMEFNDNNERRTRVFYCDPQRSDQKGGCEVTHEMIRRVLPKRTSFDEFTQDDISLLMSHINSYTRKKLNNQSAYQLFSFLNGKEVLEKLNINEIPADRVNLTTRLLKRR